jgi:hypothetical protein
MKKLLFSAAIMMIVTSPALAGGLGGGGRDRGDRGIGDCKGCNSSAYQEVFGPPDVPPAAHPRGYPYSPGYNYSYGYSPQGGGCHNVRVRVATHNGHAVYQTRQVCG